VGIGTAGSHRPVIVVETWPERRSHSRRAQRMLISQLQELGKRSPLTDSIQDFLLIRAMPVDIRHNAKIFREKLAVWAAKKLRR
jgi:hypothetical protein